MSTTVAHIIDLIDRLPEVDRELLDRHLADRVEKVWQGEAESARRKAKTDGMDGNAIDEAT